MSDPLSQELPCHNCGYDLRAHPKDGTCPECNASIAISTQLAALPIRPAWRNSDPRWRRRILLGLWTLTLLPFFSSAIVLNWTTLVPFPVLFDFQGLVESLDDTQFANWYFTGPILFSCGLVLLFSKERNRRPTSLDWTRRWGVFGCYLILFHSFVYCLFLAALVINGVAAIFLTIPPEFAPSNTYFFVNLSYAWLRYGPHPGDAAVYMLAATSSITLLLACVPLYTAIRSTTRSLLPLILLAPLLLFALLYLSIIASLIPNPPRYVNPDLYYLQYYFDPEKLTLSLGRRFAIGTPTTSSGGVQRVVTDYRLELFKFLSLLSITLYLTHAQLLTHFRRSPKTDQPPA